MLTQIIRGTHLTISALGPLRVQLGAEHISRFEFERVRALLVYLALEPGLHERTWLAYLFWPDAPCKTGLQNVRQTLAALKRALRDTQHDPPFVVATPTAIGLNQQSHYSLDVNEFARLIEQTERHNHRHLGVCASCIHQLEQAVSLYRGDFARGLSVDSEPFEEWLLHTQEHLRAQALRALGSLTDYYLRRHTFDKAIQFARRQLALDPLNDSAHHQLIEALAGNDQRYAALKHCQSYHTLLESEGMLPLPAKTIDLHRRLMAAAWQPMMACPPRRHNLPKPLDPFIGYKKELVLIHEQLASTSCRLLTLSGIAGSGKSRVAIEAAWAELANFQDGVFYIELESVAVNGLLAAIATVLLSEADEAAPLLDQLSECLRDQELLLVLDGFDHLIQTDTLALRRLLHTAPRLQILVTSRERLKIQGEVCLDIRGLAYPGCATLPDFEAYDAVRLFVHRSQQWRPGFTLETPDDREAVLQICHNVGGNPRALELYAQLVNLFPLGQMLRGLDRNSDWVELLRRGLPWCQHSLKTIFYASWRALTEEEQRALVLLAAFRDTFTLTVAQDITQASLAVLLSLHAKSCLHMVDPAVESRSLLSQAQPRQLSLAHCRVPPLLRFYLLQILEREPAVLKKVQRQHALYFMNFLHQSVDALADERRRPQLIRMVRHEQGNIDQALAWTVDEGAYVIKAQLEQDLTLLHLYESRHSRALVDEPESRLDTRQPEWA